MSNAKDYVKFFKNFLPNIEDNKLEEYLEELIKDKLLIIDDKGHIEVDKNLVDIKEDDKTNDPLDNLFRDSSGRANQEIRDISKDTETTNDEETINKIKEVYQTLCDMDDKDMKLSDIKYIGRMEHTKRYLQWLEDKGLIKKIGIDEFEYKPLIKSIKTE